MNDKRPRGSNLDKAIHEVCQKYLDIDPRIVRITRALVQRELGLNSRSTLVGKRAEIIDGYAENQRKKHNISKSGKKVRSKDERIEKLKIEIEKLKKERDQAISDYCAILNGLKIKGIDIDDVFFPIFNS